MKNIITILLILLLPIVAYIYMSNNSSRSIAVAKDSNLPTLITFSSTMCMDCQRIKSVLAEVEPMYSNKINFEYVQALEKNKKVIALEQEELNDKYVQRYLVDTPDNHVNELINYWLKRQISLGKTWGRVYGKGFRDVLQDTSSFVPLDPSFAKNRILNTEI